MLTAGDLHAMLHTRYSSDSWAYLEEVPDSTGFNKSRSCDAMAMSLWPSRGLELHGFEIKVERSDWLRELKDPAKAETFFRYCDRWWIVAPADVVKDGELPPSWGLLVPRGKQLVQKVAAKPLTPCPVDRGFLAALLRRATENVVQKGDINKLVSEAHAKGVADAKHYAEVDKEVAEKKLANMEKYLAEFEAKSGIKINEWTVRAPEMGAIVNILLNAGPDFGVARLLRDSEEQVAVANKLLSAVKEFSALREKSLASRRTALAGESGEK